MRWLNYVELIKIIISVILIIHFGLTIIYVMPLNPVKIRTTKFLQQTYFKSFFAQNWSFFAPNPASQSYVLLLKPQLDNESPDDQWYDITTPLWKNHQENRLATYDRIARVHTTDLRGILSGSNETAILYRACQNGDSLSCVSYTKAIELRRLRAQEKLVRANPVQQLKYE